MHLKSNTFVFVSDKYEITTIDVSMLEISSAKKLCKQKERLELSERI